jgi:hypothetical protein
MTTTSNATTSAGAGSGAAAGGGQDPAGPPRRRPHPVLVAVAVFLLITIPAGYFVLSGYQSRDSGEDKERTASARSLIYEWPSKVQQRIYDVPVPDGATYVAHYESNSWERSTLYVQFRAAPDQLNAFLEEAGTDRGALVEDTVTIARPDADAVGWSFDDPARTYASTTVRHSDAEPEVAITVDVTHEERARVYAVSTALL